MVEILILLFHFLMLSLRKRLVQLHKYHVMLFYQQQFVYFSRFFHVLSLIKKEPISCHSPVSHTLIFHDVMLCSSSTATKTSYSLMLSYIPLLITYSHLRPLMLIHYRMQQLPIFCYDLLPSCSYFHVVISRVLCDHVTFHFFSSLPCRCFTSLKTTKLTPTKVLVTGSS